MRNLFFIPVILLGALTVFQSCSKESANDMILAPVPSNVVNATIEPNKAYQMSFNSGEISISKQASHFKVSQVESASENSSAVYKYIPAADFMGSDEVVLSIRKAGRADNGACGDRNNYNNTSMGSFTISYTTIKINVIK